MTDTEMVTHGDGSVTIQSADPNRPGAPKYPEMPPVKAKDQVVVLGLSKRAATVLRQALNFEPTALAAEGDGEILDEIIGEIESQT